MAPRFQNGNTPREPSPTLDDIDRRILAILQRDALIASIEKATKSKAWSEALAKNDWTPAWMAGDAFASFVDQEFASLRATMVKSGMV